MIKRYNNISLVIGVPGILIQTIGGFMPGGEGDPLGLILVFIGTALFILGLGYYARAKGRHPAWCLMGFLSIIGLIVLALLKDRTKDREAMERPS